MRFLYYNNISDDTMKRRKTIVTGIWLCMDLILLITFWYFSSFAPSSDIQCYVFSIQTFISGLPWLELMSFTYHLIVFLMLILKPQVFHWYQATSYVVLYTDWLLETFLFVWFMFGYFLALLSYCLAEHHEL